MLVWTAARADMGWARGEREQRSGAPGGPFSLRLPRTEPRSVGSVSWILPPPPSSLQLPVLTQHSLSFEEAQGPTPARLPPAGDWTFVHPLPDPQHEAIWRPGLWGVLGSQGYSPHDGVRLLLRRDTREHASSSPRPTTCHVRKPGGQSSPEWDVLAP